MATVGLFYLGSSSNSLAATTDKMPIYFELNKGQEKDATTRYIAQTANYKMQLTNDALKISLPTQAETSGWAEPISVDFENASRSAVASGLSALDAKANYLRSNNPQNWIKDIPLYQKVAHTGIYPNVDVIYYDKDHQLEHDFIVSPGGDPKDIVLSFSNVEKLYTNLAGDLVFENKAGRFSLTKPSAYQTIGGQRKVVAVDYMIGQDLKVKLAVGDYDTSQTLIIDPVLVYSGYLPGVTGGSTSSMYVDALGNAYVVGQSADVNVIKINSAGKVEYSTTIGGANSDRGFGIVVDATGSAYLTGVTNSPDFPTVGPYQSVLAGSDDAFVTKIDPTGQNLLYSTYLGGSGGDNGKSIALDAKGNSYVVGSTNSADFPTTKGYQNAFQGTEDVFVAQLDNTGSSLLYSSYLGGKGVDSAADIYVDSLGNIYVAGSTNSADFPTSLLAYQSTLAGSNDAFVTEIDPTGLTLLYSTYLGGSGTERTESLTVDALGNAYLTGSTQSADFPLGRALDSQFNGVADAFVTKLAATGSTLVYSTYLGGSRNDSGLAIATDADGNTYVAGITNSTDLTVVDPLQSVLASGFNDAFISKINATGSAFFYSTYLGGTGNERPLGVFADGAGGLYTVGTTDSSDFPSVLPIAKSGSFFIAKIDPALIAQAESVVIAEGDSSTVEVLPVAGNAGISAVVTNKDDGNDGSLTATAARFSADPGTANVIDLGGQYVALKIEKADANDRVGVDLYYPSDVVPKGNLRYFDGTNWQDLKSSSGVDPINDTSGHVEDPTIGGIFSFTLDNTSSPKITDLKNTVIDPALVAAQSEPVTLSENSTANVSVSPVTGTIGISALVTNNDDGIDGSLKVTVARFSSNPGTADVIDIGGGYVDLKIEGADLSDTASVELYYPSTVKDAAEASLGLKYFDGTSWQTLKGSGNTDPTKDTTDNLDGTISGGEFNFTLDNTSSLKVTELSGTAITATAVSTPTPPPPPPPQPAITIESLIKKVQQLTNLKQHDRVQLIHQLEKAQKALSKSETAKNDKLKAAKLKAAIRHLENFIKKVEKMTDKKGLDKQTANSLIDDAKQIVENIKSKI